MMGFWSPVLHGLERFFRTWGCALYDSAPPWLKGGLLLYRNPLEIEAGAVEDLEKAFISRGRDIDLLLSPANVLSYTCTIPSAAKHELTRVVKLEAERVMPISTTNLLLSYRLIEREAAGSLKVMMVAARRDFVERLLKAANRNGLSVRSLVVADGVERIGIARRETRWYRWRQIGLVSMATLLLILLVAHIPAAYEKQLVMEAERVDSEIRDTRKSTAQIAGLQQQVHSLETLSQAVQEAKRQGQILSVLSALTVASPDAVVVEELRVDGRRLYLSGKADAPEEWVIQLQNNDALREVRLTSVLDRQGDDLRQFEVHATIVWSGEEPGS